MTEKVSPQRGVEDQLKEAETKLRDPPTSVDELLPLLDHVEHLLMGVQQSPVQSVLDAISPITDAVVSDVLFRHLNVDVKVAVASCISEITRITAPDAPYDDDRLKEVFQLIVSAFEDLSDKSSRSYHKRVRILETVANVRSCVVMLDLECDDLILEMFKLFLATIRDSHPDKVFSSMETIMVLVIKESEEISQELLAALLAYLKKGNQEGSVAVRLAEKVFEKCAAELKPYLSEAIKSLEDYTEVVTAVFKAPPPTVENTDEIASADPLVQKNVVADENVSGPPNSMDADENVSEPPNSVINNGVDDNGKENSGIGAKVEASVCASEKSPQDNEPSADKFAPQSEDDESDTQKPLIVRGGKPNSSMNDSDASHFDGEKEVENQSDAPEISEKDSLGSSREEDALVVSKSPDMGAVKSKASDSAINESSTQSESIDDDDHPKKTGKKRSVQEEPPSLDITSKKASKAARSVKKAPLKKKQKISADVDTSKIESEGVSDSKKEKQMKQVGKKRDAMDESSVGKNAESKKRRKTKPSDAAEDRQKKTLPTTSSSNSSSKDESSPKETPRISSKGKRAASQQKATKDKLDASLVGTRVKVWWPEDKQYYKGVVKSYDPIKKKHKIFYDDTQVEILLLKKERWEIIDDDSESSEEQDAETPSPDAAAGLRKRAKAKLNPKLSAKPGKSDVSLKSGAASSKKAKGATTKQGQKSGGKEDKRVENSPKTSFKSKDAGGSLSKGKSKLESPKTSSKSKQDSLRIGGKSKADSAKTVVKSKAKVADVAKTSGGKMKSKVQGNEGSSKKRSRVG